MIMDAEEFIEHFGKKGMKWGVRSQKRLDRAKRIASGRGTRGEKAKFYLTDSSSASVNRNAGLTGAAASRARQLEARKKKINAGRATVKDFIALYGTERLVVSGRE